MRAVIQRVTSASVSISGVEVSSISIGLLVLVGVEENDTPEDADWLVQKIARMRIFSDADGKMNLDIMQCGGEVLVVSQFTLHALTKKGNRPSFIRAAKPDQAITLYEYFIGCLSGMMNGKVKTGVFGADMAIALVNDGPVTIMIDSKAME